MTFRAHLEPGVLRRMGGLPDDALDALARVLARVCEDPFNRVHSAPLEGQVRDRLAELGDSGFIEFTVDEDAGLIRVYRLVWTG